MRRHGQREFVAGQQNAAAFLITQFQMSLELAQGSDPVLELPFPIIPEFLCRVRPITWRVRDKLFSVPVLRGKSVHFVVDEKVKTLKYRVNGGTWPCATHVSEPLEDVRRRRYNLLSCGVVFRLSSPLPTRSRPVHAALVKTIQPGCRPHRRLGATLAANGQCLRGS